MKVFKLLLSEIKLYKSLTDNFGEEGELFTRFGHLTLFFIGIHK
jgi:hypothetical protein